jgi:hypothetical protein
VPWRFLGVLEADLRAKEDEERYVSIVEAESKFAAEEAMRHGES